MMTSEKQMDKQLIIQIEKDLNYVMQKLSSYNEHLKEALNNLNKNVKYVTKVDGLPMNINNDSTNFGKTSQEQQSLEKFQRNNSATFRTVNSSPRKR